MAIKWTFNGNYSFADKRFARIYRFYVIETPVSGVSARGKSFGSRNINLKYLNSTLKREFSFLRSAWIVKTIKEIEAACKERGLDKTVKLDEEIVIHTENHKLCAGRTDSLFYAIRCSFAHGSFAIHKHNGCKYYVLENKDKDKLKARMVLKEETLLKWIDLVESFPVKK